MHILRRDDSGTIASLDASDPGKAAELLKEVLVVELPVEKLRIASS